MTRHYYFRFPVNKDSTWRAHLYEFGEREREAFANESLDMPALWREHRVWKLCMSAGYERYEGQIIRRAPAKRTPKEPRKDVILVR